MDSIGVGRLRQGLVDVRPLFGAKFTQHVVGGVPPGWGPADADADPYEAVVGQVLDQGPQTVVPAVSARRA